MTKFLVLSSKQFKIKLFVKINSSFQFVTIQNQFMTESGMEIGRDYSWYRRKLQYTDAIYPCQVERRCVPRKANIGEGAGTLSSYVVDARVISSFTGGRGADPNNYRSHLSW